jgi:drug/metabolite transporter (DMT)-like permease
VRMFKPFLAIITAILIWGLSPLIVSYVQPMQGPASNLFLRFATTAAFCIPCLLFTGAYIARKDWPRLLIASWVGFFGSVSGLHFGFTIEAVAIGSAIIALQPLLIACVAIGVGQEKRNAMTVVGLCLSLAGSILLFSNQILSAKLTLHTFMGAALIFAAGIAFAIFVVTTRTLTQTYGAARVTLLTLFLSAVPALLFFRPEIIEQISLMRGPDWATLIYLSVIETIVGYVAWNYAASQFKPSTAGSMLYLLPIFTLLPYWIKLDGIISVAQLTGAIIVVSGLVLMQFNRGNTDNWKGYEPLP